LSIKFNDVLSGKKLLFDPRDEKKLSIYVCGVTVYDRCHIGHLRAYVSFDSIIRYFGYAGYDVNYVRNFTDIDDKIINRAKEITQRENKEWKKDKRYETFNEKDWEIRDSDDVEITKIWDETQKELALIVSEYFIDKFREEFSPFNLLEPRVEPKVSEHMPQIIDLISKIIENGFGYEVEGDVYFDVPAYHEKTKNYGVLSRRDYNQLMDGARVSVNDKKRNSVDFALWKTGKEGEPVWDSPWGKGRPGWHIECSAMSCHYLGKGFDIHGGGKDLIFPHHENEIAQSEGGYGEKFSKYWMHNGFVTVDGVKMSKSLGNFLSIKDGMELTLPEIWRYLILSVHYSSPIDFSRTRTTESGEKLRGSVDISAERVHYFYHSLKRANEILENLEIDENSEIVDNGIAGKLEEKFNSAMSDDFNTAKVVSYFGETAKFMNELCAMNKKKKRKMGEKIWAKSLLTAKDEFLKISRVLGLFQDNPIEFLNKMKDFELNKRGLDKNEIENLITQRLDAKKEKDFEKSDSIRDKLVEMGIDIQDLPGITTWDIKF
jgi:cysteinyl-tRNA synthetase